MSTANTYLVIADDDFDDMLPKKLRGRYEAITGEQLSWRAFSQLPENISRFGRPILVTPAEYNVSTTFHVVPFEAYTMSGERAEVQALRGVRALTDFKWAILSSSELGQQLAQLRKDEVD